MFTYNARVPAEQQYQLIMECRRSGLTDYQWCKEHGIHPDTFYNWVGCLRKKACYDIPDPQPSERLCMLGDISVADNIYIVCGTTE